MVNILSRRRRLSMNRFRFRIHLQELTERELVDVDIHSVGVEVSDQAIQGIERFLVALELLAQFIGRGGLAEAIGDIRGVAERAGDVAVEDLAVQGWPLFRLRTAGVKLPKWPSSFSLSSLFRQPSCCFFLGSSERGFDSDHALHCPGGLPYSFADQLVVVVEDARRSCSPAPRRSRARAAATTPAPAPR